MSEQRFKSTIDEETMSVMPYLVSDKEEECFYNLQGCVDLLNEQQATITKLEQICEKKMQEIENIKYSLKEIAYKYQKEVQFKTDTDPNQAVKEVLCEQQATISRLEEENEQLKNKLNKGL